MDAVRGPFARNTTPNSTQTPHRTPPSLASYHRGTTQETRPSDDFVQPCLEITGCESIETTLRTKMLLWAGTLLLMSGGRLPKRIVFGNLEGAARRGRGGKEKEWTDCVQSDIRAFGIAGDWKATALNRCGLRRSRRVGGGSWPRGGKKR